MPDEDTRELRLEQARREQAERRLAEEGEPESELAHERRADKHAYLREKLGEREKSEDG